MCIRKYWLYIKYCIFTVIISEVLKKKDVTFLSSLALVEIQKQQHLNSARLLRRLFLSLTIPSS